MDEALLAELELYNPSEVLPSSSVAAAFLSTHAFEIPPRPKAANLSLVLRHHPLFCKAGLLTAMRAVLADFATDFFHLCGSHIAPRVGWRNPGPALYITVRRCFRPNNELFQFQWV